MNALQIFDCLPCAKDGPLHDIFGRNALNKSCKISKKLFIDIQFDTSWVRSAGSDQGHIHIFLMKHTIFIVDLSNTQLLLIC